MLEWVKDPCFTVAAFFLTTSRSKVSPSKLPCYLNCCHHKVWFFLRIKQKESEIANIFKVTDETASGIKSFKS